MNISTLRAGPPVSAERAKELATHADALPSRLCAAHTEEQIDACVRSLFAEARTLAENSWLACTRLYAVALRRREQLLP